MKSHLWKKAAALALVLSLFISLLSVAAMAEESNAGGDSASQTLTTTAASSDEPTSKIDDPSLDEKENLKDTPIDNTENDANTEESPVADASLPEQQSGSSGCVDGGAHTLGEKRVANYTSCGGGYQTEYYVCSTCSYVFDVHGNIAMYTSGDDKHTPGGEKHAASYTSCGEGFLVEYYYCKLCGKPVDASGNAVSYANGTHTPGSEKHEANYTSCGGGKQVDYYYCTVCSSPVDADGNKVFDMPGDRKHQKLISVPATVPTYEDYGMPAHWECPVCHYVFADIDGKTYTNADNFLLPKLTRGTAVTTEKLTTVPDTIKDKFTTVEAIQTVLQETAAHAGFDSNQANAVSVLLDVTLQIKNADGTLTLVAPDDFPSGGVTVVIPYPEGTDKSYTFFLTHMITHGPRAGQQEVLTSINGEDGLYVYFTSMSPVCISYILESNTPAPVTSAPAPAVSTASSNVPKTSDATHGAPWGMLALLSVSGLGALAIAGKKLRCF